MAEKLSSLSVGDAVTVPGGHEGFITEPRHNQEPGSVCAFINFTGDGMYVDYDPKNLEPRDWTTLSPYMKRDLLALRRKIYLEAK